jgi:hypothetical protein
MRVAWVIKLSPPAEVGTTHPTFHTKNEARAHPETQPP